MEKTSLEILSGIHSELEELLKRVGELDRRLSRLLGETSLTSEEPEPAEIREPVEQPEEVTAAEGPAFDIMMDDDVDFVASAGKPSADKPAKAEPEVPATIETTADKPAKAGKAPKEKKPAKPAKTAKKPSEPDQSRIPAWRTAVPASPLTNILSGISLKERGLLINSLFKEDAQLFIDTVSAFNAMKSLDEAEAYVISRFPNWKLDSDNVYKLMMAVRRKLN